jgi:hypothetical protein
MNNEKLRIKSISLLIYLCLFSISCFGQKSKFLNIGYDRIGQNNFIKVGYKIALTNFGEIEKNFHAFSTDLAYSSVDNKSCYSPSLTYNFYGLFYYTGISANYFIRNNEQDFRFAPQIGLTYFNVLNLGYSFYLPFNTENEIKNIERHSFNISVSIPIELISKTNIFNNQKKVMLVRASARSRQQKLHNIF